MDNSGRVGGDPNQLLRAEALDPQFHYECTHLLPHYVAIEKVLAAEYLRMGVLTPSETSAIIEALDTVSAQAVAEWRDASLSDLALALERCVESRLPRPVSRWHVDRSRNDLQACAQLMFGRQQVIETVAVLAEFWLRAHRLAGQSADLPMPGYTQFQAAQIITPGFYLAAVGEEVLHVSRRLLATYDEIDACPLGAGAMAGQHLDWNRDRMAQLLGFRRAQPLAITSVAARGWVAEVTAELGMLGGTLSRFCTDLLTWSSSEYGFVELPDELSGISAAMPQKRNYPVLERIRGRTAHLSAVHLDVLLAQRNTPYTNLVEVSKESGANLLAAFTTCRSALRLFTEVLGGLTFRAGRMAEACRREYFGGFTLANTLTLDEGVPWRRAQVIAGEYITEAMRSDRSPSEIDGELLGAIAAKHGFRLGQPDKALAEAFTVDNALERLVSAGSARPKAVRAVLADQADEYQRLGREWTRRSAVANGGT